MIDAVAQIHPTAEIGEGVTVGPFSVIEENVVIGRHTVIANNVTICKHTKLGERNHIHPGVVLGGPPQDLSYADEKTRLVVGSDNVIREGVTINRGTAKDDGTTRVADHNFLMAFSHVAHDCILEDHVVMCNLVLLAGHVKVESHAYICGGVAVHQFSTVGQYAFVGGMSGIGQDVPPFMIAAGNPASVRQVNVVGLKRGGFSDERITRLRDACRVIWKEDLNRNEAFRRLEQSELTREVRLLVEFLRAAQAGKQGRAREALRRH